MATAICNSRILGAQVVVPGSDLTYHKTLQCSRKGFKKITIDDGDAHFMICAECLRSYMTKGSKKDEWLGWFDCSFPAGARVEGSAWWATAIRAHWDKHQSEKTLETYKDQVFPPSWCREYVEKLLKYSPKPVEVVLAERQTEQEKLKKSKKQELEEGIAAIQAWMKGEGKTKFKEQVVKLRELNKLRVELKML